MEGGNVPAHCKV